MNRHHFLLPGSLACALLLSACGGSDKHHEPKKYNQAPTATNASLTTQADTVLTGTLPSSDPDGDKLAFAIATAPKSGKVVLGAGGTFTYTPAPDSTGTDQFTFTVEDTQFISAPATVAIKIDPLLVAFGAYSRKAFAQDAGAQPLPLNTRNIQQDVTDPTAYDDLLD